jgi:hypothetical protein
MKEVIIKFFNNNRTYQDKYEDFNDFQITWKEDSLERKGILEAIINGMEGGASASIYKSFIELELYYQYYKIKYRESGGKKLANDDMISIIKTTKKFFKYFKKANKFYFICKNLKKVHGVNVILLLLIGNQLSIQLGIKSWKN